MLYNFYFTCVNWHNKQQNQTNDLCQHLLWMAKWTRIAERYFSVKNYCSSIVFTTVKRYVLQLICWLLLVGEQFTCTSWTPSLVSKPLFCYFHNSSDRKRQKAGRGLGIRTTEPHALFHRLVKDTTASLYMYILSHRRRNQGLEAGGWGTGGICSPKFSVCATPTLYALYYNWSYYLIGWRIPGSYRQYVDGLQYTWPQVGKILWHWLLQSEMLRWP